MKKKFSAYDKEKAVLLYKNSKKTSFQVAKEIGVSQPTIIRWTKLYDENGIKPFLKKGKSSYSNPFKKMIVKEYLRGDISAVALAAKYGIPSETTIFNWLKKEQGIKIKQSKSKIYNRDYKIHTLDEKKKAIDFCVLNNKNYVLTAEVFNTSYSNIYNWVGHYEKNLKTKKLENR